MTTDLVHIPLREAFLCEDCQRVGNSFTACPGCGSATSLLSLARVLNRETEEKEVENAEHSQYLSSALRIVECPLDAQ